MKFYDMSFISIPLRKDAQSKALSAKWCCKRRPPTCDETQHTKVPGAVVHRLRRPVARKLCLKKREKERKGDTKRDS